VSSELSHSGENSSKIKFQYEGGKTTSMTRMQLCWTTLPASSTQAMFLELAASSFKNIKISK
jgi:hypothetical protein